MGKYVMEIEIDRKEVDAIFERLEKAKDEIYKCWSELDNLGIVRLKTDGEHGSTPSKKN